MKLSLRKAKKEKISEKVLFSDAIDYRTYELSNKEKIIAFSIGMIAGSICGHIFFGSFIVDIIAGLCCGVSYIPAYRRRKLEKRSIELTQQFKDLLENLATSICAGTNVPDSIKSAYQSLANQYGENAYIVTELKNMILGFQNNINIEMMFLDFGNRSGNEDIISFSDTFETSYRKGGNMKEIIKNTYEILNDKITIELEVKTMIAASKSELYVMMCMPILFSLVLNLMGGDLMGHGTMMGRISTIIALIMFALAYVVGKKLMDIRL